VAAAPETCRVDDGPGEQAINYAHAIKGGALARLGRLLKEMPKATGGDAQRTRFNKVTESTPPPTLADIGIDKKTSMIAQQIAALPKETRQERDGKRLSAAMQRTKTGAGYFPLTVNPSEYNIGAVI
jgi:hypothetical protein